MEQIAENVYIETGYDGVNVGAIVSNQGVIAIDAPSYPRQARDWAIRLQSLSLKSIIYVILTDYHGDRVLNARWFNAPIITHQITADKLSSYDKRFPAPLIDSLIQRNPQRNREFGNNPVEKPSISFSQRMRILKGQTNIELIEAPGPTSSNIWVHLPKNNVLFAGDTVIVSHHPFLFERTSTMWLNTLERLQNLPQTNCQIIPGRGTVTATEQISPIREYILQLQARVQEHISHGRTREETAVYIPEFFNMFPQNNLPPDWIQRQIKKSFEHVYDELKTKLSQNNGQQLDLTLQGQSIL